jgi:hypothetical protein
MGGERAKETVFCRVRASGRLSIDGVTADCGAEVPLLAEDMPLMRNSLDLSFVAAPLMTKPASGANTGLAGCELCMEVGGVTNSAPSEVLLGSLSAREVSDGMVGMEPGRSCLERRTNCPSRLFSSGVGMSRGVVTKGIMLGVNSVGVGIAMLSEGIVSALVVQLLGPVSMGEFGVC